MKRSKLLVVADHPARDLRDSLFDDHKLDIGLEASEGSGDTVDERAASLIGIDATEARFMFLSTQLGTA